MGDKDESMAPDSSSSEEASMPDISFERDAEGTILHEQGMWGKCENVVDPEAFKRPVKEAKTQNESAFNNMENAKKKYCLEDTDEYKYFVSTLTGRKELYASSYRPSSWLWVQWSLAPRSGSGFYFLPRQSRSRPLFSGRDRGSGSCRDRGSGF